MASILEVYSSFILVITVAAASAHVTPLQSSREAILAAKHERWMARHGRVYESKEEKEARFKIFKDNVNLIHSFNRARNQTFKLGINQFADLTHEEFVASHASGYKNQLSWYPKSSARSFMYENVSVVDVEPSMDWRAYGAVTPVKNQLHCSSCWAFSAVAAIEGLMKIKTGRLISLSEQELLDCIPNQYGCQIGNYMENGYSFVAYNGGLVTETDYPYEGVQGPCRMSMAYPAATITSYENIPYGDEIAILRAVANQPVSVSIDGENLRFYRSGIVTGGFCGTKLNHVVTIVGYGTSEDGIKYWLVKNSWGDWWGENGYVRLQRDSGIREGMCGLAIKPSYPIM